MTATTTRKQAGRTPFQLPYGPLSNRAESAKRVALRAWGPASGAPVARFSRSAGRAARPCQPEATIARVRATSRTGFRRLRIQRTLEVTGSCIMLTGFLVLALFG